MVLSGAHGKKGHRGRRALRRHVRERVDLKDPPSQSAGIKPSKEGRQRAGTWAVRIRSLHGFPLSPRLGACAAAAACESKWPPAAAAASITRTVANSRSRTATWRWCGDGWGADNSSQGVAPQEPEIARSTRGHGEQGHQARSCLPRRTRQSLAIRLSLSTRSLLSCASLRGAFLPKSLGLV